MSDILPGRYNFPTVLSGDNTGVVSVSFDGVDISGSTVKIQFKSSSNSSAVVDLSSTNGDISISGNDITIPSFVAPQVNSATSFSYDLQITLSNGSVRTYLSGSMKVVPDITRG